MRVLVTSMIVAFGLSTWGCGSDNRPVPDPAPVPTPAPSPIPTPTPGATVTIDVVSINGSRSFLPNPATLPSGQLVVWHNVDSVTHRVVLNDGSFDTGNLAPNASSQPMTINVPGGGDPYHCSIHPEMVGTLVRPASSSDYQVR
jgi:plastocyanin